MNSYEQSKKFLNDFVNTVTKYRKLSYSGRGRPKKSDYIYLKVKDIREYQLTELLSRGFETYYVKPTGKNK